MKVFNRLVAVSLLASCFAMGTDRLSAQEAAAPLAVAQEVVAQEVTPKAGSTPEVIATATESDGTPADRVESSSRPLNVTADLVNGSMIGGTLVDVDVVNIKTAFGEAAIPLSEVAGIRFASRDDVTTTVVMINGDSITGATNVKVVTIETEWGTAKVNGSAIQSLMLIPNLKWLSNPGISGKRWQLVDAKTAEPATNPISPNGIGAASQSPLGSSNALPNPTNRSSNMQSQNSNSGQASPGSLLPPGTYLQNGILYRSGVTNQE